jgi:hypothetical protein
MLDSRIVNMGLGQGHQVAAALFRSFCGSGSTRSKALTWFPRDRSPLPDSAKSCRICVFVRVFEEHVLCRHVSEMQRESQQLLFSVTCSLISFSSSLLLLTWPRRRCSSGHNDNVRAKRGRLIYGSDCAHINPEDDRCFSGRLDRRFVRITWSTDFDPSEEGPRRRAGLALYIYKGCAERVRFATEPPATYPPTHRHPHPPVMFKPTFAALAVLVSSAQATVIWNGFFNSSSVVGVFRSKLGASEIQTTDRDRQATSTSGRSAMRSLLGNGTSTALPPRASTSACPLATRTRRTRPMRRA